MLQTETEGKEKVDRINPFYLVEQVSRRFPREDGLIEALRHEGLKARNDVFRAWATDIKYSIIAQLFGLDTLTDKQLSTIVSRVLFENSSTNDDKTDMEKRMEDIFKGFLLEDMQAKEPNFKLPLAKTESSIKLVDMFLPEIQRLYIAHNQILIDEVLKGSKEIAQKMFWDK